MANKTPGPRSSKTSSAKKSVMKQPTPIDSRPSAAAPENAPTSFPQPGFDLRSEPGMEEEIRQRAYELYEERGRQHGFEQEDWARAEAEVRKKYQREKSA